jgi:hypothetical protein
MPFSFANETDCHCNMSILFILLTENEKPKTENGIICGCGPGDNVLPPWSRGLEKNPTEIIL